MSSSTQTTSQLAARFTTDPSVSAVSPNYLRYVDAVPPDDPGLAFQWGLGDVRAGDAWQTTTGSGDVVIASIDTGVDVLHPDLAANLWHNPGEVPGNGVDDDGNGYVDDVYGIDTAYDDALPMDDYGHGTHTSGIAAAAGDNALGVAGLGWSTKVMALKFINYEGGGTDADAIECIDYAVREKLDHGVNVVAINASWGGGASNLFLRNAIDRAGDAGIVFVASAGNDAEDNDKHPHYPSSLDCPTMLSVAATASDGRLAYFSNWGRVSVDLAAPGEDILSALPDGRYESWSGTSMAAPFVTGAVALCAARYPGETAEQRVDRILDVRAHRRPLRVEAADRRHARRGRGPGRSRRRGRRRAAGHHSARRRRRDQRHPGPGLAVRHGRRRRLRRGDDGVAPGRRRVAHGDDGRRAGADRHQTHPRPAVPVDGPRRQRRGRRGSSASRSTPPAAAPTRVLRVFPCPRHRSPGAWTPAATGSTCTGCIWTKASPSACPRTARRPGSSPSSWSRRRCGALSSSVCGSRASRRR